MQNSISSALKRRANVKKLFAWVMSAVLAFSSLSCFAGAAAADLTLASRINSGAVKGEKTVTVYVDGYVRTMTTDATTVSGLIVDKQIGVSGHDIVEPAPASPLRDGMTVNVKRVAVNTVTADEIIHYSQIRRPDEYMQKGTEIVEKAGINGQKRVTYEVTYVDGTESSRRAVSEAVISKPADEIIVYGSGGTIVTPGGEVLNFTRKIDGQATAYTCEGKKWRTTYTGTTARVGAVAVDPKYIPLGTVMYISGPSGDSWVYGVARAEDTGGAIKGHIIDLYMDTYRECINFGRQNCTIYLIETN